MVLKRFLLQLGSGVDLHGRDYTKAAQRAVEDAIRRIYTSGRGVYPGGVPKVLVGPIRARDVGGRRRSSQHEGGGKCA